MLKGSDLDKSGSFKSDMKKGRGMAIAKAMAKKKERRHNV